MTLDDTMEDEVKVTIIATGFQEQSKEDILKQPKRDILGRPTMRRESENFIMRGIKKELAQEVKVEDRSIKKRDNHRLHYCKINDSYVNQKQEELSQKIVFHLNENTIIIALILNKNNEIKDLKPS